MFFIHQIGNAVTPYEAGILRIRSKVEPTAPVSSSASIEGSPSAATSVLAAYERAHNSRTPRRRFVYARELMSQPVTTLPIDALIREAVDVFSSHRFRHIPVLSKDAKVVGIISDRDVLRYSTGSASMEQRSRALVSSIMKEPVLSASPDTEIREVARVMIYERVGCIPIVELESLVGIVTRSDILKTLVMQAPLETWG